MVDIRYNIHISYMSNNIATDALIGGMIGGGISYFTGRYYESINYVKIIAFIYATPVMYFFMLYILSNDSKTSMNNFTMHALLGTITTMVVLTMTVLFRNSDPRLLVGGNFISLMLVLAWYFYFRVYELI